MANLFLSWFGSGSANIDDKRVRFRTRKAEAVLIYLTTEAAIQAGDPTRREVLLGLLWPDYPEKSARQSLRTNLSNLRTALSGMDETGRMKPFLVSDNQMVQINLNANVVLDVAQFTGLLTEVTTHEHQGLLNCAGCRQRLEQAVALYTGDFLEGFYLPDSNEFETWASIRREAFRRQMLDGLENLTAICINRSDLEAAELYARRQLEIDPFRESAHRQLMTALARKDQRPAAISHFKSLGRLLQDEMGIEPSLVTTTLYEAILDGELVSNETGPPAPVTPVREYESKEPDPEIVPMVPHNLSPQPTPFVGRQEELGQLTTYLVDPQIRLITVIGPGGIGKTRLAIAAAERVVADSEEHAMFSNGVYFVSLAPLSEAQHIAQAIANAFDVRLESSDTTGQLLRLLRGKRLLLILDNFEHLLEGAAQLSEILEAAPESKIIVTSRERLQLQEEQVFPIEGLGFPSDVTLRDVTGYPAIQLFVQTARRVQPSFSPSERELVTLVNICKRLDGMPLAIELAAAWADTIPLADIADELQASLDLLETQMRNVPSRHRSMRAMFDASWDRLQEQERRVMGYLCPFRGGFTRHAAQAVAGATLPILSRLGNKSLIQPKIAEQRYQLHELLRQFTTEKMTVSGAIELARDAHSEYYVNYVFQRQEGMRGRDQKEALKAVSAEYENIRVAYLWAARGKNYERIARAMDALFMIYYDRTRRWFDGVELWQRAVTFLAPEPHEEPHPVYFRLVARHPAPRAGEIPLLEDALEFACQQGDTKEVAQCNCLLGWAISMTGELQAGVSLLEQGTRQYRQLHDRSMLAEWLRALGIAYQRNGQGKEALEAFHEGLTLQRELDDLASFGSTLHELVWLLRQEGQFSESDVASQELVGIYQELELIHGITVSRFGAAFASFLKGDFVEAESWIQQARSLVTEASYYRGEFELGLLANLQGHHKQAWQFLDTYKKFSKVARKEFYAEWGLSLTACCLERYAVIRQHLQTALTLATTTRGQGLVALTLPVAALMLANVGRVERAVELLALGHEHLIDATGWLENWSLFARLRADMEATLGAVNHTSTWERGRGLDLLLTAEQLIEELRSENLRGLGDSR